MTAYETAPVAEDVPPPPRRAAWLPGVLALLVAGVGAAWCLGPNLVRDQAFEGDLAQHVFWGQRAWGSDLFLLKPDGEPVDPFAHFYASDAAAPPLWKAIVHGMGHLGEIQRVNEAFNLLLYFATIALLWRLARSVGGGDPWAGLAGVACLPVFIGLTEWFPSGMLQRSFAVPLTALTLLALHERRMWLLGVAFVGSALLYPITIVSAGAIGVVHELYRLARDRRLPRGWWLATIGGVAALALILLVRQVPDAYGDQVTADQARTMPIFLDGGRNEVWLDDPVKFWIEHHRTGFRFDAEDFYRTLAVVAAVVVAGGWRRLREVPAVVPATILTGLGLFLLSHATLFALYLPNRHVWVTFPLGITLLVAWSGPPAFRRLAGWARLPDAWRPVAAAALVLIPTVNGVKYALRELRGRGEILSELSSYQYLRSTPPDTLVAGLPLDVEMDDTSVRSGRPLLVNYETAQGWYPEFYDEVVRERVRDSINAHYATDWETIDALADRYGVDVFVFRGHTLKGVRGQEPMRSMAVEAIRRAGGRQPVMYEPPADRLLWWMGDVRLIRVGTGPASATRPGEVQPFPDLPDVDLRQALIDAGYDPDAGD